jgi:hypothetical protein
MAHYSTRDVLDDLIEKRLIVPDGQMRRNRKGDLELVYVVNPLLAGKRAHIILSDDPYLL